MSTFSIKKKSTIFNPGTLLSFYVLSTSYLLLFMPTSSFTAAEELRGFLKTPRPYRLADSSLRTQPAHLVIPINAIYKSALVTSACLI